MALEKLRSRTKVGVEFVGVETETKSEIRDSAHLWASGVHQRWGTKTDLDRSGFGFRFELSEKPGPEPDSV